MEDKKWTLQSIGTSLSIHMSKDVERDKKTDAMYKLLVTGNGNPPLPEVVRNHAAWIEAQKKSAETTGQRGFEMKKGFILLVVGQAVTLIGAVAAVWLGIKR